MYIIIQLLTAALFLPTFHYLQNILHEFWLILATLNLCVLCFGAKTWQRYISAAFLLYFIATVSSSISTDITELQKNNPAADIFHINLPALKDSESAYERGFALRRFLSKIKHEERPFFLVLASNSSHLSATRGKLLEIPGMQDLTPLSIAGMLPWSNEPQIFFRRTGNFFIY